MKCKVIGSRQRRLRTNLIICITLCVFICIKEQCVFYVQLVKKSVFVCVLCVSMVLLDNDRHCIRAASGVNGYVGLD